MSIGSTVRRLPAAALALITAVLVLVGPLAGSASAAGPVPAADASFFSLLNNLRATLGLGSVVIDPSLSNVARGWSEHMAGTGVMAHNPALSTQVQGWAKLGENVGWGGAASQIFTALVASPVHLQNMSDPDFTSFGAGTVADGQGRLWTTHVFMRPKAATAPVAVRPAAPPTTRAPAPPTTRAPRTVATTTAPTTAPPTTAASVTAPAAPPPTVTVTAEPVPSPVEPPTADAPAAALAPTATPVLVSSRPSPERGGQASMLVGAGLLILVVLGGAGLLRQSGQARRRSSPTA